MKKSKKRELDTRPLLRALAHEVQRLSTVVNFYIPLDPENRQFREKLESIDGNVIQIKRILDEWMAGIENESIKK